MANYTYFNGPTTGYKQYQGKLMNGAFVEFGEYSFTTTGTTVEVPTYLGGSTLLAVIVTPTETVTVNETLYCDLTITSGAVTVTRVSNVIQREFHFPLDNGQIASNDYSATPLMIAQAAMTLTNVEFYKKTAFGGGTVIMNLGTNADDGKYLEDISVTNTAASTDTTTSFTSGTAAVVDGDVIEFLTEGGTSSGPADGVVSISATETATYTSGLTFSYIFLGLS